MSNVDLVLDAKALLGEGPTWDAHRGVLFWVDIMGETVNAFTPATGATRRWDIGQPVGAVVLRERGGLLVAAKEGFFTLDEASGTLTALSDPESHLPENRFNDGKCDPAGRFWAGTMGDGSKATGNLYRLEANESHHRVLDGICVSNGLGWSPDEKTMYYIDTPTCEVSAFDYDNDTGHISNPRAAVKFIEGEGYPDGMCVDVEGKLWIAHWEGSCVSRWDPESGRQLEKIAVPVRRVTSCAFGGEHLDELFITTCRLDVEDPESVAGGIFCVKPGVQGLPSVAYKC
jgi:sugar lactone lactonase YvrE